MAGFVFGEDYRAPAWTGRSTVEAQPGGADTETLPGTPTRSPEHQRRRLWTPGRGAADAAEIPAALDLDMSAVPLFPGGAHVGLATSQESLFPFGVDGPTAAAADFPDTGLSQDFDGLQIGPSTPAAPALGIGQAASAPQLGSAPPEKVRGPVPAYLAADGAAPMPAPSTAVAPRRTASERAPSTVAASTPGIVERHF